MPTVWDITREAAAGSQKLIFGEPCTITAAGGGASQTLVCIFTEHTLDFSTEGDGGMVDLGPSVDFRTADLDADPSRDDALELTERSRSFSVRSVTYDGDGGVRCMLMEVIV